MMHLFLRANKNSVQFFQGLNILKINHKNLKKSIQLREQNDQ